jgi:hypothetical protein
MKESQRTKDSMDRTRLKKCEDREGKRKYKKGNR